MKTTELVGMKETVYQKFEESKAVVFKKVTECSDDRKKNNLKGE